MQEESVEKENTIKHHVTKDEIVESFHKYLGEKHLKVLKTIDKKKLELFSSLLPNVEKEAYFVKGSEISLNQFRAYFIARCLKERYEYASFMLKDYAEGIVDKTDSELFLAGIEKPLLFLYLHGETPGIGNTDNWISGTAIDKMVNRKRKGLITVILSERTVPSVEGSKEVKVLDLGGAQRALEAEAILKSAPKQGTPDYE